MRCCRRTRSLPGEVAQPELPMGCPLREPIEVCGQEPHVKRPFWIEPAKRTGRPLLEPDRQQGGRGAVPLCAHEFERLGQARLAERVERVFSLLLIAGC